MVIKKYWADSIIREALFVLFLISLLVVAYYIRSTYLLASWFGFFVSAYSVIANDSIQTIGTFLSSNKQSRWWVLWIYVSVIFFLTLLYSWLFYNGDISHQRLMAKGFEEPPDNFVYLQLAAPVILLGLTRAKVPVSTSFLVLGTFVGSSSALRDMIFKSIQGYVAGFSISLIFFMLTARIAKRTFIGRPPMAWYIGQWIVSGLLWSVWLQQDLANIAVFLPRSLSPLEFLLLVSFIVVELGVLLFLRGGRIQSIIAEKSDVSDPRYATMIDAIYALVLFYFRTVNRTPMSTTWVFLGLLGGREISMWVRATSKMSFFSMISMLGSDIARAVFGFLISIWLSTSVNPHVEVSRVHKAVVEKLTPTNPTY